MAQDTHLERQTWTPLEFLGSLLGGKTEPKSRKIPSKFDVMFDVCFGRRFFTLGVDFPWILGWFVESKTEPRGDPRGRSWILKNSGFTAVKLWFFNVRPAQERAKIHHKRDRKADSDLNTYFFWFFPVWARFWEPKWRPKRRKNR